MLDELRREFADVDRQILELVAERQRLSKAIGSAKREAGLPTRDYEQEKEVIVRARAIADECHFSSELAEQIMQALVRSSLTIQEKDHVAAHGEGGGRRVLVIGGRGRMGQWFVRFLLTQAFEVEVADPAGGVEGCHHYSDWREVELSHDYIVVAAPLGAANDILLELADRSFPGVIFDIGSLKGPVQPGLRALVQAGARVTSLHPMFGPDTELLSGRHVIFVDVGVPEATRSAEELFSSTMIVQAHMDLDSHDRLIAWVIGLSHALNIAFLEALAMSGEAAPKLVDLSSTTFDDQLRVSNRVVHDSPKLYFEIQSLNEYGTESLTALLNAVERLRTIVQTGDEVSFTDLMENGRRYLEGRRL